MKVTTRNWFSEARYGLFVHYGLYSLLGRAEWSWNREEIPSPEYRALANRFTAKETWGGHPVLFLCPESIPQFLGDPIPKTPRGEHLHVRHP